MGQAREMANETDLSARARQKPPTPGWVKLFAAIGILLVLVVVVLHLTGNGFMNHGALPTATERQP